MPNKEFDYKSWGIMLAKENFRLMAENSILRSQLEDKISAAAAKQLELLIKQIDLLKGFDIK